MEAYWVNSYSVIFVWTLSMSDPLILLTSSQPYSLLRTFHAIQFSLHQVNALKKVSLLGEMKQTINLRAGSVSMLATVLLQL